MKTKIIIAFTLLILTVGSFALASTGLQQAGENLNRAAVPAFGAEATTRSANLPATIGRIISYLLTILGAVFLILIIYSGITWMTAGGEPEKIKKATAIMKNATIGLIIVLAAYAISYFVFSRIAQTFLTPSAL